MVGEKHSYVALFCLVWPAPQWVMHLISLWLSLVSAAGYHLAKVHSRNVLSEFLEIHRGCGVTNDLLLLLCIEPWMKTINLIQNQA